MPVKLSPPPRQQYMDANGDPAVGHKLFAYAAGSTTKQTTYTDNTGLSANTNPIILDASGRTPYGIWLTSGLSYKLVLAPPTDTDPPTSAIFTEDLVTGVNDITTPAALAASSQWVASAVTPTYVNATQFTLVGDQRTAFHVGRRLRFTVTAGTVYGEISVSAYTTLTTVTVVLDSGALDAGLSAVDVGILTANNSSIPKAATLGAQPIDALLTSLAGQTTAANKVQAYSGADTATLLTTGTASGNIPLIGTESATETLAGLSRRSTTSEAQSGLEDTAYMTALKTAAAIASVPQTKAWVVFDGTAVTPITPTSGFNVTDVTKNGTGDYTINFTSAISDANYFVGGVCSGESSGGMGVQIASTTRGGAPLIKSTTQLRIYTNNTTSPADVSSICVQIVR